MPILSRQGQLAVAVLLGVAGCAPNPLFVLGMVGKTYTVSEALINGWSQDGRHFYAVYDMRTYRHDSSLVVVVGEPIPSAAVRREYALEIVDVPAGEAERRAVDFDASWTPANLAYLPLRTYSNSTGDKSAITLISPDGKFALYAIRSPRPKIERLGVIELATGTAWNRGEQPHGTVVTAAWSPDSRQIVYRTEEGLFLDAADGRAASAKITEQAPEAAWLEQTGQWPILDLVSEAPDEFRAVIKDASGRTMREVDLSHWRLPSGFKRTVPCVEFDSVEARKRTRKDLYDRCQVDRSGRYLMEYGSPGYFIMDMEKGSDTFIERTDGHW